MANLPTKCAMAGRWAFGLVLLLLGGAFARTVLAQSEAGDGDPVESPSLLSWQWRMFLNGILIKLRPERAPPSTRPPASELLVIGAGLPRTGTNSLKAALDHLGYHAYHARAVNPEGHHPAWKDLFAAALADRDGGDRTEQLEIAVGEMLGAGYDATTDFPACLIAPYLARRFPNAKVVLSVRDSPEKWAESYGSTVGTMFAQMVREPIKFLVAEKFGPASEYLDYKLGGRVKYGPKRRVDRESLARAYEYWIEHVKESVEGSRLLLHNSKDGWGPLCRHLEISEGKCPTVPYPHTNDKSAWKVIVTLMCFLTDTWPFCLLVPPIILVWCMLGVARMFRIWLAPRRKVKRPPDKRKHL